MPIERTETQEQIDVVAYLNLRHIPHYHVPNESKRSVVYGAMLKKMGMSPGVPDLVIPVPNGRYHGLYIEMKTKRGRPTENQKRWLDLLQKNGYKAVICHGFDEARQEIDAYTETVFLGR